MSPPERELRCHRCGKPFLVPAEAWRLNCEECESMVRYIAPVPKREPREPKGRRWR